MKIKYKFGATLFLITLGLLSLVEMFAMLLIKVFELESYEKIKSIDAESARNCQTYR